MDYVLITALVILLCNLAGLAIVLVGSGKIRDLNDVPPLPSEKHPRVSIIVPACNEEDTIEPALRSLLNLAYSSLEIIVVNDRSTDRTGDIVAGLQQEFPQLEILTIHDLPPGWLGKSHALYLGAKRAGGDFLLFTDADIIFADSTLARAMTLMVNEKQDHLSLTFKNTAPGLLLNAMIIDAGLALFSLFRPWKVRDPGSKTFIGVGAFNLVRKSAYLAIGGHEPIRMHPIDDIMLGKLIKRNGFRQDFLAGHAFLSVSWYTSPGRMITGLMKNIFALYDFRVSRVVAALPVIAALAVLPPWGILLTSGAARLSFLLCTALRLLCAACGARYTGTTLKTVPFSLLTPYINIYIVICGMLQTLRKNGIVWRGTHYPLDQLKKNLPIL